MTLWLAFILVAFNVVFWASFFKKLPVKVKPAVPVAQEPAGRLKIEKALSRVSEEPPVETAKEHEISKLEEPLLVWGRDPFASPLEAGVVGRIVSKITEEIPGLTGIVGEFAMFGDQIVSVGDVIGEKKVVEINPNEVVLIHGKERIILKLFEEE